MSINNLKRVRISSIEITELSNEFMDVLKRYDVIVDHMHIPLQSGSNEILKLMNRKYNVEQFMNILEKLRTIRPNMLITTDVIVGFPNETEELFLETVATINKIKFSKLHVFPYSKREGTAAAKMKNHVDPVIKKERVRKLLKLSKKLEVESMQKYLGKTIEFIPEVYKNEYLIGHADNYLSIKAKGKVELLNKPVQVLISAIKHPYCIGELVQ